MAELVDAPDSKSGIRKDVGVRFPLPVPKPIHLLKADFQSHRGWWCVVTGRGNRRMLSVEGKLLSNILFLRFLRLLRLSYHNVFSALQTSALIHFFSKRGRVTTYIIFGTGPKTSNRGVATFNNIPVAGGTTFVQLTFF